MQLRRMGWAGHVACMRRKRNRYRVLVGVTDPREIKDHIQEYQKTPLKNIN